MSDTRIITDAPQLGGGARAQMLDALYSEVYQRALPREQFDQQSVGKSDLEIANATYDAFYKGHLDRDEFNRRVGLTSASGSTRAALMQGLSFGFADEVGAAASGAVGALTGEGFGPAYDRSLKAQRENLEVFRQNNPYVGRGLEFAGGVIGGGPSIARNAVEQVARVTPSMGRTVATAAGMGAAQGFGEGEGLGDRLAGAAAGGVLGGAMAGILPAALRLTRGAFGRVAQMTGLADSEETAARLLLRALEQDGLTPTQAMQRLNQWQGQGAKPEALFDIAGENTRRLARTAASVPGPGTERAVNYLAERQGDQATRIAGDVTENLGQSADDFFTRRQVLTQQRQTAAAPLYDRAFRIQLQPDEYGQVARFVEDPIGQDALRRGLRVVELEHLAEGRPFDPQAYGVQRVNGEWAPVEGQTPNMRLLDAVKRGFDEIVEGFRDPTSGRLNLNQYGRAVDQARGAYRATLAGMFHPYRQALEAWSGPSQAMDAMARGRGLFSLQDAEAARLATTIRNSPTEAEFFRLGVAQAIQERIASAPDGADAVKRIFGSRAKRALLRASFPDEASFNQFAAQMQREAAMYRNAQFVSPRTGSQTQLRQTDAETIGDQAMDLATALVVPGKNFFSALTAAGANVAARSRGVTPEVADELTQRLFADQTPEVVATLRRLNQQRMREALARQRGGRINAQIYPRLTSGVTAAQE